MEFMTVPEAAATLGLSVRAVRERIRRGDLRAERLGVRVWAIPQDEVERAKALGRMTPGPKRRVGKEGVIG